MIVAKLSIVTGQVISLTPADAQTPLKSPSPLMVASSCGVRAVRSFSPKMNWTKSLRRYQEAMWWHDPILQRRGVLKCLAI
jgi:hypothetical protein